MSEQKPSPDQPTERESKLRAAFGAVAYAYERLLDHCEDEAPPREELEALRAMLTLARLGVERL